MVVCLGVWFFLVVSGCVDLSGLVWSGLACLAWLVWMVCLSSSLTRDAVACARSAHGRNSQGLDNSRKQKNKLPYSASEMGVGSFVNIELLGCCLLPSNVSAPS